MCHSQVTTPLYDVQHCVLVSGVAHLVMALFGLILCVYWKCVNIPLLLYCRTPMPVLFGVADSSIIQYILIAISPLLLHGFASLLALLWCGGWLQFPVCLFTSTFSFYTVQRLHRLNVADCCSVRNVLEGSCCSACVLVLTSVPRNALLSCSC